MLFRIVLHRQLDKFPADLHIARHRCIAVRSVIPVQLDNPLHKNSKDRLDDLLILDRFRHGISIDQDRKSLLV